jgi:SlyX protein
MESQSDTAQHTIDARLTELEIKLSYQEDTLEQLNTVIVRQQEQIDLLLRELLLLRQQVPEGGGPAFRSLRDDLPPHY